APDDRRRALVQCDLRRRPGGGAGPARGFAGGRGANVLYGAWRASFLEWAGEVRGAHHGSEVAGSADTAGAGAGDRGMRGWVGATNREARHHLGGKDYRRAMRG